MNRIGRSLAVLASVLALGFLATGCKSVEKATGTYEVNLNGSPDKVVEAVKGALTELKFTVIGSAATKLDGEVTARTAQDKAVSIKVKSTGENVSRMTVKVGSVGDKTISDQIINETQKRMK